MKVEQVTLGGAVMFRITLGDRVRTTPAGQALVTIREAISVEQARLQELQRALADAQQDVKRCIAEARNPTEARARVTTLQADIAGNGKAIDRLIDALDEIKQAGIEQIAAPLRQQSAQAIAHAVAQLPAITKETS